VSFPNRYNLNKDKTPKQTMCTVMLFQFVKRLNWTNDVGSIECCFENASQTENMYKYYRSYNLLTQYWWSH